MIVMCVRSADAILFISLVPTSVTRILPSDFWLRGKQDSSVLNICTVFSTIPGQPSSIRWALNYESVHKIASFEQEIALALPQLSGMRRDNDGFLRRNAFHHALPRRLFVNGFGLGCFSSSFWTMSDIWSLVRPYPILAIFLCQTTFLFLPVLTILNRDPGLFRGQCYRIFYPATEIGEFHMIPQLYWFLVCMHGSSGL